MEKPVQQVHTLVTHHQPHPDEYEAIRLLRLFGRERYPGVENARVLYVDAGSRPLDTREFKEHYLANWQELLKYGCLAIGVYGGPYDEHPYFSFPRKVGESAASLVAKDLGIMANPAVAYVNRYVTSNDLHGKAQPFEFANLLRAMHLMHSDEPSKVMRWATQTLQAKYNEQQAFQEALRELAKADIREIRCPQGILHVGIVQSDSTLVPRAAFSSRHARDLVLLAQKKSAGHVQIYTSAHSGLNLVPIVRAIRTAERGFKGISGGVTDAELISEGRYVPGAEEWAYIGAGQMLLNGSLSATSVPPTRIPFGNLVAIVLRELPKCWPKHFVPPPKSPNGRPVPVGIKK